MAQDAFVFTARGDESIAISVREDGANLPPAASGEPWAPSFRTTFSEKSFAVFGVEPAAVFQALRTKGFYVGKPVLTAWRLKTK
jgi:hypothetical protein